MTIDTRISGTVAALYLVLVVALLPATEYPRALGGSLLVFGAVAVIARWLGRGPFHGMSMIAVASLAAIVLVIPAFPAMGGTHRIAVPIGFLGVQAAVLLWAALRWQQMPPAKSRTSLKEAWGVGLLVAFGLSVMATIPTLLILIFGERSDAVVLWVHPAYFAGMLSAATCYWLLQRIAHLATGRYLIGVLGGACVYGAVAPVVTIIKQEPMNVGSMLVSALVLGGLAGPAFALDTSSTT